MSYTQPILFDESIGQWRFRTKADDEYAKAISREVFGHTQVKTELDVLLHKLANITVNHPKTKEMNSMSKQYDVFKEKTVKATDIIYAAKSMQAVSEDFAEGFAKAMWEAREIFMRVEDGFAESEVVKDE